jgi:hypothetical protein
MIDNGKALYTIREKRLFRATYATFEDYVQQRWKLSMEVVNFAIDLYLSGRN